MPTDFSGRIVAAHRGKAKVALINKPTTAPNRAKYQNILYVLGQTLPEAIEKFPDSLVLLFQCPDIGHKNVFGHDL